MLAETMLSNLYIIPKLLDQNVEEYDIWHSSSEQHVGYVDYTPKEVISTVTEAEIQWIRQEYGSVEFRRIRKRYIEIYHKLINTKEISDRKRLLEESYSLVGSIK